ncbi:MAG: hypothetical protein A3D96_04620 [Chlamydiae bacterium RIFCSPHIGHO2_12_FULL_44_59]|nr:MAG: hypothetical protein A2796_02100 [Chlamydiae bacterium RIFCSPHIGHO2_01_FULL_44_39]OGN57352.1 MAG: hypothetical protein A3C42_01485 [Chlamydiae bacterium RIFCSPHIGHO2_02_FULL_45_9]OGN59688.1 MAG: hypothetical protein A3D96_04620 [Chlamydiae bacterium RIFCSPHIGHO2_12_FULL_44_59]OGN65765.1 MAG: hypothetical protein A2978_04960 [Chlamydiae bacterium RIFCSPLOWO2_01_FULL_44_52]OGN67927.1 MAG: hypothetical protein A3I67_00620 [Chlamydiae bacterium RIFCSPLOWO2_02_FULL_45_22]OGN69478.1 MAG: hyp
MNLMGQKFFRANKEHSFKEVIWLSERNDLSWEVLDRIAYNLPRGWYELSRVSSKDRIEFTRDFWLDRLPYHPRAHPMFFEFFERLDDVAVVLTRHIKDEPMEAELVYSFADNSTFFRGRPPCSDSDIQETLAEIKLNLPRDYLSFLKIHNGFGKLSEMGVLEVQEIADANRRVIELVLKADRHLKSAEKSVDPGALVPFFEALGLSSFQCFYADWYPGSEMGTVYLSGIDYTISDLRDKNTWVDFRAFPTFSEWLAFYLQGMDLCT